MDKFTFPDNMESISQCRHWGRHRFISLVFLASFPRNNRICSKNALNSKYRICELCCISSCLLIREWTHIDFSGSLSNIVSCRCFLSNESLDRNKVLALSLLLAHRKRLLCFLLNRQSHAPELNKESAEILVDFIDSFPDCQWLHLQLNVAPFFHSMFAISRIVFRWTGFQ